MYDEFYLKSPNATYYLRGRGYIPEDFQRVASEVCGCDFTDFFTRYVRDVEVLPYDEAFGYLGLRVVRETAREPYNLGISVDWESPSPLEIATVRMHSPAEEAGLQEGDEIISLARKSVTRTNWLVSLSRYKQGDQVPVTVKRDRRTIKTTLAVGAPDRFEYRIEERKDATPQQKALREAWMKGTR
jgi:predicted metalloprotease with PDZ domain